MDSTEILRLAAIVASSEDAIIGKNLNGIVESWNAGAEQLYGYTREEMCGRPMSLLVPSDRRDEEARVLRAIHAGERVRHFETVRLRKGGQPIDVSLTISPLFDTGGAIVGASHVARDITGSKRFEERVQQLQKLEGLGALAGGIAHDFTRLLSGISGSAGRALDALPPDSPARAELADVAREAERASLLTRQILAYAAKRRYSVETLSLSEVVKEIAHLLEALIPPNVQLRLELDGPAPRVEGDAGQLQQAIMNLVVNAAEAIGSGDGSIVVRTGALEVEETAGLAVTPYAALEVHDTGCGMDEMAQGRIFDAFFTTKLASRGLGLAAVRGIVRDHRGSVKVYSAPGQGSTFKILIPVSPEPALASAREDPARSFYGSGHVLIADDEEMIRIFAKSVLEHFGYTVTLAGNGLEAVDLFAHAPNAFDLVLLDLTMPAMNGEEVYRRLQKVRPGVPVLLSSGFNETSAVRHFAGQNLAGFLQKPYSSRQLAERIKAALANDH